VVSWREARRMLWRHIDLKHGVLRLDVNKTGAPRVWALSAGVARTFSVLAEGNGRHDYVFPLMENKIARLFREDLELAGIDRAELFERTPQRRPIRVHDLRATFITTAMNDGRSEAWICDRTGHTTSGQLNGYRRAARTAAELCLGSLEPLDQCLPELQQPQPNGPSTGRGVQRVCNSPSVPILVASDLLNDSKAVRETGVEPARLAALEPKSSASANSATRARAVV
jgi:hypothetical protein